MNTPTSHLASDAPLLHLVKQVLSLLRRTSKAQAQFLIIRVGLVGPTYDEKEKEDWHLLRESALEIIRSKRK